MRRVHARKFAARIKDGHAEQIFFTAPAKTAVAALTAAPATVRAESFAEPPPVILDAATLTEGIEAPIFMDIYPQSRHPRVPVIATTPS